MFCPKCGNQIESKAQFCPKCGAQLPSSEQDHSSQAATATMPDIPEENNTPSMCDAADHPKRKRIALVAGVAVLVVLIVGGTLVVPRFLQSKDATPITEQAKGAQSDEKVDGPKASADGDGNEDDSPETSANETTGEQEENSESGVEFTYSGSEGMVSTNAVAITDLTWEKVDQNQFPADLREDAGYFSKRDAYLVTFNAENLTDKPLESRILFKATATKVDHKGNAATNETSFFSGSFGSWNEVGSLGQGLFLLAPHEKRPVELYTTWADDADYDPSPHLSVVSDVTYAECQSSQFSPDLLPLTDETIELENGTGTYDYKPTYGDLICRGASFSVTNTTEFRIKKLRVVYGYRYGDTLAPALFYREMSDIAPGETVSVRPDEGPGRYYGEQIPVSDLSANLQMVPLAIEFRS